MYTFKIVEHENGLWSEGGAVAFTGQTSYDVVRNDGKVVRSGMKFEYAEADCELLSRYSAEGWTAERYHAERKARMAVVA